MLFDVRCGVLVALFVARFVALFGVTSCGFDGGAKSTASRCLGSVCYLCHRERIQPAFRSLVLGAIVCSVALSGSCVV